MTRTHALRTCPSPEQDLAIARVKLALQDLRSRHHRRAGLAFFTDRETVTFFDDLLGLEGALVRYAATLAQGAGRAEPVPQQLALFAEEMLSHA